MATFFCVFLKIIEGGQNPGSTFTKCGALFDPSGQRWRNRRTVTRYSRERPGLAVCGLNSAGQCTKGDGLLAKLELEVPDEVKLAQAEVELIPAFMTKSGGPYKCPP